MLSKKAYQILYNDAEEAVMLLCRAECSAAAEAGAMDELPVSAAQIKGYLMALVDRTMEMGLLMQEEREKNHYIDQAADQEELFCRAQELGYLRKLE